MGLDLIPRVNLEPVDPEKLSIVELYWLHDRKHEEYIPPIRVIHLLILTIIKCWLLLNNLMIGYCFIMKINA